MAKKHRSALDAREDFVDQVNLLCELNAVDQVVNVAGTSIVQDAWARGQSLSVHGRIYGLQQDGLLRDLEICLTDPDELEGGYESAVAAVAAR